MTIAKITTPGLTVMAILVAILWGCFVAERLTMQKAHREMRQALREMHRPVVPASMPQRSALPARRSQS